MEKKRKCFNPLYTNEFFNKFDTIKLGWYFTGPQIRVFKLRCTSISEKIVYIFET